MLFVYSVSVIIVCNKPVVCVAFTWLVVRALRRTCESICPGIRVYNGCTSPALTPYRQVCCFFFTERTRQSLSLVFLFFWYYCMRMLWIVFPQNSVMQ